MIEPLFSGFEFSPLELKDGSSLAEFLRNNPQRLTGYTFATLAAWRQAFDRLEPTEE